MEETLQLREVLVGAQQHELVQAALCIRFADNPNERLAAIEAVREDVAGATPGGSVSKPCSRDYAVERSSQRDQSGHQKRSEGDDLAALPFEVVSRVISGFEERRGLDPESGEL